MNVPPPQLSAAESFLQDWVGGARATSSSNAKQRTSLTRTKSRTHNAINNTTATAATNNTTSCSSTEFLRHTAANNGVATDTRTKNPTATTTSNNHNGGGGGDGVIEVSAAGANLPSVTLRNGAATNTATATANGQQANDAAAAASNNNGQLRGGNNREKTPMCLVNELARYNKLDHQYHLTSEDGPPHRKRFTVTLKLGIEEYTAEEASIKKAQHSAAGIAITATKYRHPPPKVMRPNAANAASGGGGGVANGNGMANGDASNNLTPTVILNALAMKRGETTTYTVHTPVSLLGMMGPGSAPMRNIVGPHPQLHPHHHHHNQHQHQQQQQQQQHPHPFIGVPFGGYGPAQRHFSMAGPPPPPPHHQQQQHHAAFRPFGMVPFAARRPMVMPMYPPRVTKHQLNHGPPVASEEDPYRVTLRIGERIFEGVSITMQGARHAAAAKAIDVLRSITPDQPALAQSIDSNADCKSPISLIHEIALKRELTVSFRIVSEKGPPHMKTFVTVCLVGTIRAEGEGNGKKTSKKKAAITMLHELRQLPPLSPVHASAASASAAAGGLDANGDASHGSSMDGNSGDATTAAASASAAVQPSNGKKKSAPAKKKARNLIKEDGTEAADDKNPISRLIRVSQAHKAKEPLYELIEESGTPRRREFIFQVTALNGMQATGAGTTKKNARRQAAENLLELLDLGDKTNSSDNKENQSEAVADTAAPAAAAGVVAAEQSRPEPAAPPEQFEELVPVLDDALDWVVLDPNETSVLQPSSTATIANNDNDDGGPEEGSGHVRPTQLLLSLAKLSKFNVQFSDLTKGRHGHYLTLVTLSTMPPQISHGSGQTQEESREAAAGQALYMLSQISMNRASMLNSNNPDVVAPAEP